ncbi:MAG: hypothetical protein L0J54_09755 [Halomonas sp.]|nr:hypothetical protein [Halomonas sp.]MDN6298291.1 hypothetical protein [Halomonas sp.]MDN6315536.1 hypothetical protein [Halomonas sp.]MDN6336887.1 hypothetical protein [Halomonas sp.]
MKTFQKAPIALAVGALMMAPVAFAENGNSDGFSASSSIDSTFTNEIDVELGHTSHNYNGTLVGLAVFDDPAHYSGAIVDSKQFTDGNEVNNQHSENNATVGSGAGNGATGNVGINVAAGDNNAQANDAALASSDAADVFGQSQAYSAQHAAGNATTNAGSPNDAVLGSGSLAGASGNIGVNIAAGTSNAQQNSLAASSNESAGHTKATTGGVQQTTGNSTSNVPHTRTVERVVSYETTVGLDASGLEMDQVGDVYPDMWTGDSHSGGSADGHFDLDTDTQGGSDLNGDGGALAFGAAGDTMLETTVSGSTTTSRTLYTYHSNDATLGSNALQGASGNVGVNIAAGTNNLQRNSLSIASSMGGGNGGSGSTE